MWDTVWSYQNLVLWSQRLLPFSPSFCICSYRRSSGSTVGQVHVSHLHHYATQKYLEFGKDHHCPLSSTKTQKQVPRFVGEKWCNECGGVVLQPGQIDHRGSWNTWHGDEEEPWACLAVAVQSDRLNGKLANTCSTTTLMAVLQRQNHRSCSPCGCSANL